MKANVIIGFLGAGKTTLLQRLIDYLKGKERVAIVINEFGDVGIDGSLVQREESFDMVELSSGCICCTVRGLMVKFVAEVHEKFNPDRLLIEATGIAWPPDVLIGLKHPKIADFVEIASVILVADGKHFLDQCYLFREEFFEDQIGTADIIILNKADLIPDETTEEEIKKAIRTYNSHAEVIKTKYGDVDIGYLLGTMSDRAFATFAEEHHDEHHHHEEYHDLFMSFSYEADVTMNEDKFMCFIKGLPQEVYRLKGFVRFGDSVRVLQYSQGDCELSQQKGAGRMITRLAFVAGNDIDKDKILAELSSCVEEA